MLVYWRVSRGFSAELGKNQYLLTEIDDIFNGTSWCLLTVEAGNEQVRVHPSGAQIHLTISGALRMPFGCLFWCSNMI